MQTSVTKNQRVRASKLPGSRVQATDIVCEALKYVQSAWVTGNEVRFEFENPPDLEPPPGARKRPQHPIRPLISLFWGDDTPSVTYMKGGRDLRYRWTLDTNRWRSVYRAWLKIHGDRVA